MHKTYITTMPDKAGAFLVASRVISECGGNIARVNYNKAVDIHTLFIEVSATEDQHEAIAAGLLEHGYLASMEAQSQIIMIVLTLPDVPGAIMPVLEILQRHNVNISYMSSQEEGTGLQHFKMGVLVEDSREVSDLLEDVSKVCEVSILDYEVTDRLLDGTVFYVTFANEMRGILGLDQDMTNEVLVCANRLMQQLDERNRPVLQTFDYIRRFATFVRQRTGDAFKANVNMVDLNDNTRLIEIEPPCGSNTSILQRGDDLLFVDSGFACYRDEMLALFRELFPGFDGMHKRIAITHADVDHVGLLDLFDEVYLSQNCYENFLLERAGKSNFREQNPLHEPYCFLSKVIAGYEMPPLDNCRVIGGRDSGDGLCKIGTIPFGDVVFDCYEGPGGHIRGETVFVCDALKLVFSGDIYVNIKGFSPEQREFNSLAPFLMTGVDADPATCRASREYLLKEYQGYLFCPGHGPLFENKQK